MPKASETRNAVTQAAASFEPMIQASNKMLETWLSISTEMLEFSKARIDQSLEMSRQLAQSSSINEAIELQTKFTRSMMQDCLAEASKIADLSSRTIIDGFAAMQKGAVPESPPRAQAAE